MSLDKIYDSISMAMDKPLEGWPVKLTLKQYTKLDDDRKRYYGSLYAKYRTKKIRDYDQDTGKFCGWRPIQVGIGEPIGWKYVGYLAAKLIDDTLSSNVLMSRVLNRPKKWD